MPSTVKDLTTYVPMNNTTEFCLDTNVLYWYTYPRYMIFSKRGTQEHAQSYYDFVDRLVENGNPLLTTRYNITELINIVEKHEYDIFCAMHPEAQYTRKDFRRISEERKKLKRILKTTLSNVNSICETADFNFTEKILDNCVNTLDEHRCDVFDFAILSYYKENKHLNIITDDNDFASVDGIKLYTDNTTSLSS